MVSGKEVAGCLLWVVVGLVIFGALVGGFSVWVETLLLK